MTKKIFFVILSLIMTYSANAKVKLPAIFSDNMVLQQNENVKFWGWSDPNEKITVKADWQWFGKSTIADSNGQWSLVIKTPKTGKAHTIKIKGSNSDEPIIIKDVLLGEVWLCSGQSNMEWPVKNANNGEQEVANANYPDIRLFEMKRNDSPDPVYDCDSSWKPTTPESIKEFSAVAYFFGREIHNKLNVPIGLIDNAYGGTPAEAWMKRLVLENDPCYGAILERLEENLRNFDENKKEYDEKIAKWQQDVKLAKEQGKDLPERPGLPGEICTKNFPTYLYNAMLTPIMPYTIKGVI